MIRVLHAIFVVYIKPDLSQKNIILVNPSLKKEIKIHIQNGRVSKNKCKLSRKTQQNNISLLYGHIIWELSIVIILVKWL